MREEIYSRLWPGERDYEGSNKPYERQIPVTGTRKFACVTHPLYNTAVGGSADAFDQAKNQPATGGLLLFELKNPILMRR
jgi:hypothetical protein